MGYLGLVVALILSLLHFPQRCVSNAVSLSLSSPRATAYVTLTGKFTPTNYVPGHSSILITLPGATFPSETNKLSASVSVQAQQVPSNKLLFETFSSLSSSSSSVRDDLLTNTNYISNAPASTQYRSSIDFGQISPNQENFGYRITGALCPSVSGTYSFALVYVDDIFELFLRDDDYASSENAPFVPLFQYTIEPPMPGVYSYREYKVNLFAGRRYALIALFVERIGGDKNMLLWRLPGAAGYTHIPPDAFCTGWASMTGNVLRVFFTWPLMPNSEVTFTVATVPNPHFPQAASSNVASIIKNSQVGLLNSNGNLVMQSVSGTYPAIMSLSPSIGDARPQPHAVALELSSTLVAATDVTLTGTFTPSTYIPAFSSLFITIHGAQFPSGTTAAIASIYVQAQGEGQTYHLNQFNRVPRFVKQRILFEKFENLGDPTGRSTRNDMLTNSNFISNSPPYWFFRDRISFGTTQPDENFYGYRITGAICPTLSGSYEFKLTAIDDHIELHFMRDDETTFTNVLTFNLQDYGPVDQSSYPQTRTYFMQAGRKYAMIALFVERSGGDVLTLAWRPPGSSADVEIPPDAFCTGWASMTGNVIQVNSTWPLLPNNEVTFTVSGLRNPLYPLPSVANVSSGYLKSSVIYQTSSPFTIQRSSGEVVLQSSSGTYPEIRSSILSANAVSLQLDNVFSCQNATLKGTVTPTNYVPAFSSLVITISGAEFPSGTTAAKASISVRAQGDPSKKLLFEKFEGLTETGGSDSRNDLMTNGNYLSNNPRFTFFRDSLTFFKDDDPINNFGYRMTGALCPTITGDYVFYVKHVDDLIELRLMRDSETSFNNVVLFVSLTTSPTFPIVSSVYSMEAGRVHKLFVAFVERGGADFSIIFWKPPGFSSPVPIPPDAFCTGWASMTGNVLRVFFTWPLMPNSEVTFTVATVPNPHFPQAASSNVASGIQNAQLSPSDLANSDGALQLQTVSGLYPQIRSSMSLSIQPSSRISRISRVTLNVILTPAYALPLNSRIKVNLKVIGISLTQSSLLAFLSPGGASGIVHLSDLELLDVSLNTGSFLANSPIHFTVTNAMNPFDRAYLFRDTANISAFVIDNSNRFIVSTNEGTFPAIMCGSSIPTITLSSVVAGDPFVSMHVVLTASEVMIPLGHSLIITLSGNGITCGDCTFAPRPITFLSPSGAQGTVQIASLVMTVVFTAGSFPVDSVVSFVVTGLRNPAFPQPPLYDLNAALVSPSNQLLCRSAQGTFPAISLGDITSASAPKIDLSSVIAGSSGVIMTVSLTPVSLNVSNGRIIITLVGEGISLSSGATVQFVHPADGAGTVALHSESINAHIVHVALTAGNFPSGSPIIFTIRTVSNPQNKQSPLTSVNIGIANAEGVPVNQGRSIKGSYPGIIIGSLGSSPPAVVLSSTMASTTGITARISFQPVSSLPSIGRIIIKIAGVHGMSVPFTPVFFSSPDRGATAFIYSSLDELDPTITHLTLTLTSGVFPPGSPVSFSFGNVTNPSGVQPSISNVGFLIYDQFNVSRGFANNGIFPSITSGETVNGMPLISLSDNAQAASDVRMTVISPVFPGQSAGPVTFIITLSGVQLACSSRTGCTFSSPNALGTSIVTSIVALASSSSMSTEIRVQFANSSAVPQPVDPQANSATVMFFIDGLSISSEVQPGIDHVAASVIDDMGQIRSLMSGGSFPPIVCPRGFLQKLNSLNSSAECSACPRGMYCPFSSSFVDRTAIPCPVQTFNPREGAHKISDCLSCPEGSVCNLTGQSVPNECSLFPGTLKYCRIDRRKVCPVGWPCRLERSTSCECS